VATQKSQALASGTLSDDERAAYLKQYAENLQKAADQFQHIEEALTARQRAVALTTEEALLLWRSSFSAAHCQFYLSHFEEAIRRYNALAVLYQGQVGELGALSQVFQSYIRLKQPDQARAVLTRMKEAFDKMPESAFVGNETSYQRSFWVQWFLDAEKQFAADNKE
jgi:tetratricopeptide (TPR) repeat protein